MTDSTPRVPPHNEQVELALLGSILLDNDMLSTTAVSQLQPADFYRESHRKIWDALRHLANTLPRDPTAPGPLNLVTLSEELSKRGQLDAVGGLTYLMGLADHTPTSAYAEHYARLVQEKSYLRSLISHAAQTMNACYTQDVALEDIVAFAARPPEWTSDQHTLVRVGSDFATLIDQAQEGTGPQGVPTGLTDLDRLIGGLEAGRLYVEAARPGFGKTALAFQIATHVARTRGRVLGFSLEMPALEISARILCSEARVDLARFTAARRGERSALNGRDYERLTAAQSRLTGLPLDILAKSGLKLQELLDEVRREHGRDPLSLFVLDYVQLVQVSGRAGENPVQRVTMISNALKALAMELGIPVLALAQLSRAVEQRPNHRPLLSDLRESGSLEQDADVVLFIYRDEMYNRETDQRGIAELIVAKQRNGPTDSVKTQFHAAFTRFSNLTLHAVEADALVRR